MKGKLWCTLPAYDEILKDPNLTSEVRSHLCLGRTHTHHCPPTTARAVPHCICGRRTSWRWPFSQLPQWRQPLTLQGDLRCISHSRRDLTLTKAKTVKLTSDGTRAFLPTPNTKKINFFKTKNILQDGKHLSLNFEFWQFFNISAEFVVFRNFRDFEFWLFSA